MKRIRPPFWIAVLMLASVLFALAPAVDYLIGQPFPRLTSLINLNSEHSLPAWYSSMQWFCASVLFGALAVRLAPARPRGLAALALLAAICMVFSADEIVAIHEWLGYRSDALLPGGDRANTPFWRTGIWVFVIGVPVLALLGLIIGRMRSLFFPRAPRALALLIVGLAIMFTGALVVELGVNLLQDEERGLMLARLIAEEFLEMLGVTIVIWSAYELASAHGLALQSPAYAADPQHSAPAVAPVRWAAAMRYRAFGDFSPRAPRRPSRNDLLGQ